MAAAAQDQRPRILQVDQLGHELADHRAAPASRTGGAGGEGSRQRRLQPEQPEGGLAQTRLTKRPAGRVPHAHQLLRQRGGRFGAGQPLQHAPGEPWGRSGGSQAGAGRSTLCRTAQERAQRPPFLVLVDR
jgi:hypothetical protein